MESNNIDINKALKMIKDNVVHKQIVLDKCLLLAEYFIRNDNMELGLNLIRRGATHDNSKFSKEEFDKLVNIISSDTEKCFRDAKTKLNETERKAIEHHWKSNRHHPEYFDNSDDMTELDIIEMVCDWAARSEQYGTNLIDFVKERQHNRFKFSAELYNKIEMYCELIVKLSNNIEGKGKQAIKLKSKNIQIALS